MYVRQTAGIVLSVGGIFLGHAHGGRQFPPSAHQSLGSIIFIPLLFQLLVGIYLKLHIHERTIRPYAVILHGIIGKSYPIWGWVQMLFGAIVLLGYCRGGHLGQCLAHYIMVSEKLVVSISRTDVKPREAVSLLTALSWPLCLSPVKDGSVGMGMRQNCMTRRSSPYGYAGQFSCGVCILITWLCRSQGIGTVHLRLPVPI
jgi:hypothetical protein